MDEMTKKSECENILKDIVTDIRKEIRAVIFLSFKLN